MQTTQPIHLCYVDLATSFEVNINALIILINNMVIADLVFNVLGTLFR